MKATVKYTLIGIVVAFVTLFAAVNVFDRFEAQIHFFAFVILCAVFICTGIIGHHIEQRLPPTYDEDEDGNTDE